MDSTRRQSHDHLLASGSPWFPQVSLIEDPPSLMGLLCPFKVYSSLPFFMEGGLRHCGGVSAGVPKWIVDGGDIIPAKKLLPFFPPFFLNIFQMCGCHTSEG